MAQLDIGVKIQFLVTGDTHLGGRRDCNVNKGLPT